MSRASVLHQAVSLAALAVWATGCGSGSGGTNVAGYVSLDGQPLAEATVTFEPTQEGRPASGFTDSSGRFTLASDHNHPGIKPGKYVIRISTWQPGYDDGKWHPDVPEKVPANYNDLAHETPDMVREISGSTQSLNFELSSSAGEIAKRAAPDPTRPQ